MSGDFVPTTVFLTGATGQLGGELLVTLSKRTAIRRIVCLVRPRPGLADGLLGGSTLICPLHAWKFDVNTGRAESGQCGLAMYPARLSGSGQNVVDL